MILEKETKYGYISYYKNDMAFVESLKNNKIYEQDFVLRELKAHIQKSSTILDIGAHAGSHTVLYKYISPNAKIYCFEPQKKMFELLVNNIASNNFKNVEAFNVGVANISTEAELSDSIQETGKYLEYGGNQNANFGGMQIGENGEKIHTITIDGLNLTSCDFIKMDVEGFEPLVLLGGEKTIKKYKPTILFESNYKRVSEKIANKFKTSYPLKESKDILKEYGYKDIKLVDNLWNYLAIY
jgi:FkbM family methyltransferase